MKPAHRARIREALAAPYTRVFRKQADGGYQAEVIELPGALTGGATIDETNEYLEEAIALWIEAELEAGQDIPPPLDPEQFSGRLTFRIPPSMHYEAHVRAALEGVSLNRLLSAAVAHYLGTESTREAS